MVKVYRYLEDGWMDSDDLYSEEMVEKLKDDDELSEEEDAFMIGYIKA